MKYFKAAVLKNPDFALPNRRSVMFIFGAGLFTALLGLTVLFGWYAHIPALFQLRADLAPMQYNTALCLLFSGIGLCAFRWNQAKVVQVIGAAVGTLAALTLLEYLWRTNFGIDQLLFHSYVQTQTSNPGRMSPISALCLTQVGIALFLAGIRWKVNWIPGVIGILGSIVIAVCTTAIVGYLIGLPQAYGWAQLTRIAFHTAVGILLLGCGLFVIAWSKGRASGERTPRWLPLAAGLATLVSVIVLWQALMEKQNQEIEQTTKANAEGVKSVISVRMDARIRSLVRMVKRWEYSGHPSQAVWEDDAKNSLKDFPDVQAFEWIDASHLVRWIVPLQGNEAKLNQNLTIEGRRQAAVNLAEQSREPAVTRAVQLARGGLGFIVYVPIYIGTMFDGWIVGVFNAQVLFDRFLPPSVATGNAIRISDEGLTFYERDGNMPPSKEEWRVKSSIALHGVTWKLLVWPTAALSKQMDSALPEMVLFAGMAGSLLLALTIRLAQRSSALARETAVTNRELKTALDEVQTLSGMLPICAWCKKIRDDSGYWNQLEGYIMKHSEAQFSHGMCPDCRSEHFPAYAKDDDV